MYSVGQKVLYGSNGVCVIEDITEKKIGREKIEYYVLKPVCAKSSTLFVPTKNEALVGKIRYVLSADEIREILSGLSRDYEWENNKILRSEQFRKIISEGACDRLIMLVRTIHHHADEVSRKGKRLHVSDERFLREAEKMVCEEVSTALEIDRAQALEMVLA